VTRDGECFALDANESNTPKRSGTIETPGLPVDENPPGRLHFQPAVAVAQKDQAAGRAKFSDRA
jgi:hypothetical protein